MWMYESLEIHNMVLNHCWEIQPPQSSCIWYSCTEPSLEFGRGWQGIARRKEALRLIPSLCEMPWPVLMTNRDISGVGVLKGAAGAVKLGWQWRIRSLRVLPYMTFVSIPSWITSGLGHILISEWLRDTVIDRGDWYLWTTGTNLTLLWLWGLRSW